VITDAQVHLFEADGGTRPWPKNENRGAPLRPSWSAEEMLASMDAIGVDRAVIVPPTWAGDHNETAFEACANHPDRFAIMGRFDPFAAGAPERLEQWLSQPHMLGIRMSSRWGTTPQTFLEVLDDGSLDWYWAACGRLGIPLMLLLGDQVKRIDSIAVRYPGLRMIVDHMATSAGSTPAEAFKAIDDLVSLARHAGVHVKVSTGPNRSQQAFPFADVHPYFRKVYEAFGPRRMLWAADITQLTKNTYSECLRFFQEGLPFLSAGDKEWILGKTAAAVLRWPEATGAER
jgi:predicted TIM-barrel fold metal-dependent hydrolase